MGKLHKKEGKKGKKGEEIRRWWQVPAGDGGGGLETWDEKGTRRSEGERAKMGETGDEERADLCKPK